MSVEHVPAWLAAHAFNSSDCDCTTAVMLKILDGKCKMSTREKEVMAALYDALHRSRGTYTSLLFGAEVHDLVARARSSADEALKDFIYERRVLAESAISRQVMKAFKAKIREQGLFVGQELYPADDAEEYS